LKSTSPVPLLLLPTLASFLISAALLPSAFSRLHFELARNAEDSSSLGIVFSLIYLIPISLVLLASISFGGWFAWTLFAKRKKAEQGAAANP